MYSMVIEEHNINTHPLNEGSQSFQEGRVGLEGPLLLCRGAIDHLGDGENAVTAP